MIPIKITHQKNLIMHPNIREILARHTNVLGTIDWNSCDFSQGKTRVPITVEMLIAKDFSPRKKPGCDPDYTEYVLTIADGKEIVLHYDQGIAMEEYFLDTQFNWPTDTYLKKFSYEDQLDTHIQWARLVTNSAFKQNLWI